MAEEDYLALNTENSLETNLANFKENLQKISSQVDISNVDFQNDKIAFSAQRIILSNLLVLLPVVVQKVIDKPGQGAVYALTNVITQINDLFGQLRSSEALENQVEYISDNIISVILKELLTTLFDKAYNAKQALKQSNEFIENKEATKRAFDAIDSILKEIAPVINEKQDEAQEKLKSYLLEV